MFELTEDAINAQMEWETQCIERGVDRYHASLYKTTVSPDGSVHQQQADIGDTRAGSAMLKQLMGRLVPAIEEARAEALEGLTSEKGKNPPQWWWYMAWLPADALAYITLRASLAEKPSAAARGRKVNSTCLRMGQSVKEELEFRLWKQRSKENAKSGDGIDMAGMLIARCKGNVDRRTFSRWKKKIAEIEKFDWDVNTKLRLGVKLLDCLLQSCDQWFRVELVAGKGKTERMLYMSDKLFDKLNNIHEKLEVARPYMLPMFVPPRPWRKLDDERVSQEPSPV